MSYDDGWLRSGQARASASNMVPAREFLCRGCGGEFDFGPGTSIAFGTEVWHKACAPDDLSLPTRYLIVTPAGETE